MFFVNEKTKHLSIFKLDEIAKMWMSVLNLDDMYINPYVASSALQWL